MRCGGGKRERKRKSDRDEQGGENAGRCTRERRDIRSRFGRVRVRFSTGGEGTFEEEKKSLLRRGCARSHAITEIADLAFRIREQVVHKSGGGGSLSRAWRCEIFGACTLRTSTSWPSCVPCAYVAVKRRNVSRGRARVYPFQDQNKEIRSPRVRTRDVGRDSVRGPVIVTLGSDHLLRPWTGYAASTSESTGKDPSSSTDYARLLIFLPSAERREIVRTRACAI